MTIKSLCCLIALFLCSNVIRAQWSSDPSENLKVAGGAINPQICTDGNGGAYIAWETGAFPNRRLLRIQRLDRFGFKKFPEQGLPIRIGEFDQANLILFEDREGGAIVVFNELLPVADTLKAVVFAQRFDSTGVRVWGDSAVVISPSRAHQIPLAACGDKRGGAFILWSEDRDGDGDEELYGNRIDDLGKRLLGDEGILIVESEIDIEADAIRSDGENVIVTFNNNRDIIVQKFSDELNPVWDNGVNASLPFRSSFRRMFSDGLGGVVFTCKEQSFFDNEPFFKLWTQRIDNNGNILWNDGIVLADSVKDPTAAPNITLASNQSFYLTWRETLKDTGEVFVQLINNEGLKMWSQKSFSVSAVDSKKSPTDAVIPSADDFIVAWHDNRNIRSFDLYSQLIDRNQKRLWNESDVPISTREDLQFDPRAVEDGNGGAIITWYEIGTGTGNGVFAQQISRTGKLGDVIVSVEEPKVEPHPSSFYLFQSYPNPFNPSMTIKYRIPEFSHVTLKVFDITGKEVITLVDEEKGAGVYQIIWNGNDEKGGDVASGIYIYRLQAGNPSTKSGQAK
ncbi:T9SS type A sorting domain-containing protein [candidate division KSB1 bacterium]|nr:T9SS type A sorting domain-containing protein [candidate division KSB1 bacterium]NIR73151.1 T9SS type A sorting domain-containing protein [candidate division KSB1 bacterium]NIS23854.1 T9SS type A sorting domain-containing protein [candidate division KSB1 bacterium]NIT70775.1 T9SS type A sorting domain-containing protein [candidate division KSB1 bacterium]NIU24503.1 T9SS type A sorting domain-containing protein [candidate division KSB1 bacterium]